MSFMFLRQACTGNEDWGVIRAQAGIEGAGEAADASEEELSVAEKERQESLGPRSLARLAGQRRLREGGTFPLPTGAHSQEWLARQKDTSPLN